MLNYQSDKVKSGRRDEVEGSAKNLVGKIKETAGKALGNKNLEARGHSEQVEGSVQKKVGEIKKVFDM
jgi:uncharacterized protein YjbJ (UPF0337 family)